MRKGEAGGKALVEQRGHDYMRKIGRKGGRALWDKYRLEPAGVNDFWLVLRATGERIRLILGGRR